MTQKTYSPQAVVEIVFDTAYLLFAVGTGIWMLSAAGENRALALYGLLALVLGCGDAFHLLPRIYGSAMHCMDRLSGPLGLGKLVTSITMTVFYVLLYQVWLLLYGGSWVSPPTAVIYILAALRVALSLFPQNRWFDGEGSVKWGILRNIPFAVMGLVVIGLYASTAIPAGDGFRFLPLAVALSFGFYLPVVLWAGKKPALGALMLPKTMAYVWILCMGFGLVT